MSDASKTPKTPRKMITIRISVEKHRQLKMAAAKLDTTIQNIADQALDKQLEALLK